MANPWVLSVQLPGMTTEQIVQAVWASLTAAAWGRYDAMCAAFVAGAHANPLTPSVDRPPEDVRRAWALESFQRVARQLPEGNPFRSALEKFAEDNIDQLIRDDWTRN
jgi:hypothetical protein